MSRKRLWIKGLSYSQTQTGAYALVLGEEGGYRTLPIIIGAFEAQSIAIALEKEINPPRPLTHDLFAQFARSFNIALKEVIIHSLKEGVFHASLICVGPDGQEEVLDARTSDAVALATRFDCPVFTYEHILEKAGVVLDDTEERTSQKQEEQLEDLMEEVEEVEDLESLHNKLDQAVNNEDYEEAARIRDEISKREKE
jgi:bifunctional DNase/RNase